MSKKSPKKKPRKITLQNITVEDVITQSVMIIVEAISKTKREGATISIEANIKDETYNVDFNIKKVNKENAKPILEKV